MIGIPREAPFARIWRAASKPVMPGYSGWSVLAALKGDAELRVVPVVVIAALGAELNKGFALGAAACLAKPVDLDRLVDTLDQVTGRRDARPGS